MSDPDDDEEPPFMPSAPSDFNIFKDSLKETLNNIYAETRLNLPSVKMDDTDVRGPASAVLVGARLRLLLQDDDSEEEEIFFSGHEPLDPAGANDFVLSRLQATLAALAQTAHGQTIRKPRSALVFAPDPPPQARAKVRPAWSDSPKKQSTDPSPTTTPTKSSLSDTDISTLLSPDAPSVRMAHHLPTSAAHQTKRRLVDDTAPEPDEASKPIGAGRSQPHHTAAARTHASDYRTPIANEIARALIPVGMREGVAKPHVKPAWLMVRAVHAHCVCYICST